MLEEGNPEESASQEDEGRGKDLRTLELTSREMSLLLEYGYPFPNEE